MKKGLLNERKNEGTTFVLKALKIRHAYLSYIHLWRGITLFCVPCQEPTSSSLINFLLLWKAWVWSQSLSFLHNTTTACLLTLLHVPISSSWEYWWHSLGKLAWLLQVKCAALGIGDCKKSRSKRPFSMHGGCWISILELHMHFRRAYVLLGFLCHGTFSRLLLRSKR